MNLEAYRDAELEKTPLGYVRIHWGDGEWPGQYHPYETVDMMEKLMDEIDEKVDHGKLPESEAEDAKKTLRELRESAFQILNDGG